MAENLKSKEYEERASLLISEIIILKKEVEKDEICLEELKKLFERNLDKIPLKSDQDAIKRYFAAILNVRPTDIKQGCKDLYERYLEIINGKDAKCINRKQRLAKVEKEYNDLRRESGIDNPIQIPNTDDPNSNLPENEIEDSIENIKAVRGLRALINDQNEELLEKARTLIAVIDNHIKDKYQIPSELIEYIGTEKLSFSKESDEFKQIEDANKKIETGGLTDEECDKLKNENETREKRLGKLRLLKLKIERLREEIKTLEEELKSAVSNRKEKIESLLTSKKSELEKLEKELGDILSQISEKISALVEKEECQKHKVENFDKLNELLKNQENDKNEPITKKQEGKNESAPQKQEERNPNPIINVPCGGGSYGGGGVIPSIPINSSNFQKNSVKPKKEEPEVIYEEVLQDDFAFQYSKFPLAKIEGDFFYHTIKDKDKLKYVKEHLNQISCSEEDVLKKIKEIQDYWKSRDIASEVPKDELDKMKEFLTSDINTILRIYTGFCLGKVRKERLQELMCGMIAANLPLEAFHATQNGIYRDILKKTSAQKRNGGKRPINDKKGESR